MASEKFIVRSALVEDMEVPTRLGVLENWHLGTHDLASIHSAYPTGFFVGELNGEVISHIIAVKYPSHSAFIGMFIVTKEYRGKGYGRQTWDAAWKSLDRDYTIGLIAVTHMIPRYEKLGFHTVWNTFVAELDVQIVAKKLIDHKSRGGVSITPAATVDLEKVCSYDASVFGTPRDCFIEKWINMPRNLCWVAVSEKGDVVGYIAVRQFISDKGKEIQLGLAPLYANNDQIAKSLLKMAAEAYLSNDTTSTSKIDLFYGDGGSTGHHVSQLMQELEATATHIGQRMYTHGVPPGRQQDKIYGIFMPAFD